MCPDIVTGLFDQDRRLGKTFHLFADHEERGFDLIFFQYRQYPGRHHRVRTVIKGQDNFFLGSIKMRYWLKQFFLNSKYCRTKTK